MKLKRCRSGHYYDEDKFAECPHCSVQEIRPNKTIEIKDSVDKEVTQNKKVIFNDGKALRDAVQVALEQKNQAEIHRQKKMDTDLKGNPVGMLVVTQGKQTGDMLTLRMGKNHVTQRANGEICVTSKLEELLCCYFELQYEIADNDFFIEPMQLKENVLLNGNVVKKRCALHPYDKLSIADVQLLFIPICGEHFNWNL